MKKILTLFLLLYSSIISANGNRTLTVDDLFALREVESPQISPDGKWVSYVVETLDLKKDKSNKDLYMISTAGGQAIQLTTSDKSDTHPRWSPDNKYLAFLSGRTKKKQVFLLNRNGGEAIQLTDIKQGVDDFSWSPDSKKLALIVGDPDPDQPEEEEKPSEEEKTKKPVVVTRLQFLWDGTGFLKELYNHIYTFDIGTKQVKQITSGPYDDGATYWSYGDTAPQWSPDGKYILFTSNRTEKPDTNRNSDLFVVPSDGGELRKLTTNPGTDESPRWSPDGKWIVYQTHRQPDLIWYDTSELAVIPASGGTPKILTEALDRNCLSPRFSVDGKNVHFILEDRGTQTLATVPVAGGEVRRDISGEKVVAAYDVSPSGSIVVLASKYTLPYEVFAVRNGKSQQLTTINTKALEGVKLGATERVRYKSKDGTPVEAFVNKPPDFVSGKKYPLLLWIHGGPTSQYMEDFHFLGQLFAANGYVVLRPNPRGSTGYGEEFCKAIWADWGNKDYDDVMAGVDYLISLGYADPEKLGVGGWSYGGILTDHVITKTKRFRAAMSGASELNYLMNYGTDHYQYEWEKEVGLPWEKPDQYIKMSPFFKIQNVSTPTLVMCGEVDWNVPLINSEQLYQSLKRLGVDTMLVVYPGMPHSIYKPSYQKDRYQRYLAWFDHYLKGAPRKVPEAVIKTK